MLNGLLPLYFSTCLVANPAHCEMRVMYLDESVNTPIKCLAVAQPVMAQWQNSSDHERWRIEAYRCGKPPRDTGSSI